MAKCSHFPQKTPWTKTQIQVAAFWRTCLDYLGWPLPRTVSLKAELPWKYLDVLCKEQPPARGSNLFCFPVYLLLAKTCCKMLSSSIVPTLMELQQSLSTGVPPLAFQIIEQETCYMLGYYLQSVSSWKNSWSWSQTHFASMETEQKVLSIIWFPWMSDGHFGQFETRTFLKACSFALHEGNSQQRVNEFWPFATVESSIF